MLPIYVPPVVHILAKYTYSSLGCEAHSGTTERKVNRTQMANVHTSVVRVIIWLLVYHSKKANYHSKKAKGDLFFSYKQ